MATKCLNFTFRHISFKDDVRDHISFSIWKLCRFQHYIHLLFLPFLRLSQRGKHLELLFHPLGPTIKFKTPLNFSGLLFLTCLGDDCFNTAVVLAHTKPLCHARFGYVHKFPSLALYAFSCCSFT